MVHLAPAYMSSLFRSHKAPMAGLRPAQVIAVVEIARFLSRPKKGIRTCKDAGSLLPPCRVNNCDSDQIQFLGRFDKVHCVLSSRLACSNVRLTDPCPAAFAFPARRHPAPCLLASAPASSSHRLCGEERHELYLTPSSWLSGLDPVP